MSLENISKNYKIFGIQSENIPRSLPNVECDRNSRNFGINRDTDTYYTNKIGDRHYPLQ